MNDDDAQPEKTSNDGDDQLARGAHNCTVGRSKRARKPAAPTGQPASKSILALED